MQQLAFGQGCRCKVAGGWKPGGRGDSGPRGVRGRGGGNYSRAQRASAFGPGTRNTPALPEISIMFSMSIRATFPLHFNVR